MTPGVDDVRDVPWLPLRVLAWTLPHADREAVLGDIIEEYRLRAGDPDGRARRWIWRQALTSIAPNVRRQTSTARPASTDSRGGAMHGVVSDLRFSLRLLRQQRLMALVAGLSLVTGLGLNVLLFTVANAVLYQPLPVRDPSSLVLLGRQRPTNIAQNFPYRAYETLAARTDVFAATAAYAGRAAGVRFADGTVSTNGEIVTGDFFGAVGVPVTEGRGLTPADDHSAAPPAAVISASLWRQRFGSAPLNGLTLTVNGTAFTIVGVTADRFRGMFAGAKAEFWLPVAHASVVNLRDLRPLPTVSWLFVLARLRPGVSAEAARLALDPAMAAMVQAAGGDPEPLVIQPGARGTDTLSGRLEAPLRLLMFAAGFVLLVACVNVANLQLARNAARRRELAVRSALGASRWQLARLLLLDAAVIAGPASLFALGVAWMGREPALRLITRYGQPVELAAPIDWRVLLFAAVAAATCALGVGLLSTWHATRTPAGVLADGARGETGTRHRLQHGLVVLQFALSMTLLVGAALLVRSAMNLRNTDLGFATNVVLIEAMPGDGKIERAQRTDYVRAAMARVAAVPGIEAVSAAHVLPLDFGGSRMTVGIPDYTPAPNEDMELNYLRVMPGYFETMRIPVLRGRAFDERDVEGLPTVVIVNETMAHRFFPGGDAVGRRIAVDGDGAPAAVVVGVVPDVHYRMVREEPRPSFYTSFPQSPFFQAAIHARTSGDPSTLVQTLRRVVAEVNPQVPIARTMSLEDQRLKNIADDRMAEALGVTLAMSALVLATIGLYGTMAFAVRRRMREIGVRVALGAAVADVRRLMLRGGLTLVLLGAAVGACASLAVGRLLAGQLYGVAAIDPISTVSAFAVLATAALMAAWLPARRAARIDPVIALRE
jgi:putative ABC transport system permease protein